MKDRVRPASKYIWEDAYGVIEPQINAAGVHVWPFDPNFPLDVRFLAMRRQADIRMNLHEYFEMLYLHSGEVVYQVGDRSYPMTKGSLFVVGGALPHRMIQCGRTQIKAVALYFLPELIRAHDTSGDDVEYLMPFLVQDTGFPHVVPSKTAIPAQIFDLMQRIRAELPAHSQRARLSALTYLRMALVSLMNYYFEFRGSAMVFNHKQRNLERLAPLFTHIEENYSAEITVDDAAAAVNMSKSHFMRFFKQATGQSFVAHLNQFRVVKAQKLLAATGMSGAEVGQEVGFCNQSYFGLVFRRLTHVTPREFREHCEKRIANGGIYASKTKVRA